MAALADMKSAIEGVLRQNKAEDLRDEAIQTCELLHKVQESMSRGDFSINDAPNDSGRDFLTNLQSYISEQTDTADDEAGASKVLANVQVYCYLAELREHVLLKKCELMVQGGCDQGDIQATKNLLESEIQNYRSDLTFLNTPPTVKQATVSSTYNSKEWPVIGAYMKHVGVAEAQRPLEGKEVELRVNARPWWYCHAKISGILSVYDKGRHSNMKSSTFHFVKADQDFWNISKADDPRCRWYYDGDQWRCGEDESTSIKVTMTADKKCLLSSQHSPHTFLYVDFTNKIRNIQGDPREEGYWEILPV